MSERTYLFIGGCADGRRIKLPKAQSTIIIPERLSPCIEPGPGHLEEIYYYFCVPNHRDGVYLKAGLSPNDMIILLLEKYGK